LKKQIERKTVDILKERKSTEFYKELDRQEQILIDELALYAYMRKH
ncbi:flagellar export protein FliJ, partial [Clostridium perfringens]